MLPTCVLWEILGVIKELCQGNDITLGDLSSNVLDKMQGKPIYFLNRKH